VKGDPLSLWFFRPT